MSAGEFRRCPFTGRTVIVAPVRAERPAATIHTERISPEPIDDVPITDATPPTETYRSARLTFRSGGADAVCDPTEQGNLQQRVLSAVREEGPLHDDGRSSAGVQTRTSSEPNRFV